MKPLKVKKSASQITVAKHGKEIKEMLKNKGRKISAKAIAMT